MIFILIFSIILIWMHISNMRFIIRANQGNGTLEEIEKLEETIPSEEKDLNLRSGPGILSLAVIILLNLIELGYFVACVYIFNGPIVIISSSILAGYTFYSLFKFLPNVKRFYNKPSEYLKEKTTGVENIVGLIMTALEIIFCIYIFIIAILEVGMF